MVNVKKGQIILKLFFVFQKTQKKFINISKRFSWKSESKMTLEPFQTIRRQS